MVGVSPQPFNFACLISLVEKAIQWLEAQAKELKLKFRLYRFQPPNEFAVVITWEGSKGKNLKSILLNSHIDVVPVDEVDL